MSADELQREVMAVLRWMQASTDLGETLNRETLVVYARGLAEHMELKARERGTWDQERYESVRKEFDESGPVAMLLRRHGMQPS